MTHLISHSHDFLDKNFTTYWNDSNMNNKGVFGLSLFLLKLKIETENTIAK